MTLLDYLKTQYGTILLMIIVLLLALLLAYWIVYRKKHGLKE
jgi:LPXTG-motif cell wall-anchored protein